MSLYFVVAIGRGTSLQAHVYGPYASAQAFHTANPGIAGETFQVIGNSNGYSNKLSAQQEANKYNSQGPAQRVKQAGGNVAPDPTDLFHGINLGAWFTRIGEILLGIVLVGVGIARLTGIDNTISKAVKTKL